MPVHPGDPRSRKQILQKIYFFYDEVKSKRKNKRIGLQVDHEFHDFKLKDLNDEINVEMLISSVMGGKAFAAEQKIRELRTRISKLSSQKLKATPTEIIQNSAFNMSNMESEKYGLSAEEIEKRSLAGEQFKPMFNMHKIEKPKRLHDRLNKYDRKGYSEKDLMVGEKVFILAKRIKKKAVPGKFCKQSVQNISYFNKDRTFIIRKIQSINNIKYYWFTDAQNNYFGLQMLKAIY